MKYLALVALLAGAAHADEPELRRWVALREGPRLEVETAMGARGARPIGQASLDASVGTRLGALALRAGLGYGHDERATSILRARLVGGAQAGRLGVTTTVLFEKPFAAGRDAVDVRVGVAAAWAVGARAHLGVEALAQDLEAAWERNEAEGGASLLAGPAAWLALGGGVDLVLGADVSVTGAGTGFLGRAGLGLSF